MKKIDEKRSGMERDMDVFKRFHENLKAIDDWLANVDTSELDRPISIEPDVVGEQIHKNEVTLLHYFLCRPTRREQHKL